MSVHPLKVPKLQQHAVEPFSIPHDFSLTPALRAWAASRGIVRVEDRFEHFTDLARAKGYAYLDWDAAFRNSCRMDWAKLGSPQPKPRCARCQQIMSAWTQRRDGRVCDQCDRQGQL